MTKKAKNLFTKPTVILMWVAIIPLMQNCVDNYLTFGKVSGTKVSEIIFTAALALAQSALRYGENEDEPLYTPKFLPGKSKKDYIDLDNNGIDDRIEETQTIFPK